MFALRRLAAFVAPALLAGCASAPIAPVATPPRPAPPPPPAPVVRAPAPPAPELAWDVAPVAAGNWTYRQDGEGTIALFGAANTEALLAFRCRPAAHEIVISRVGEVRQPGVMTIRTSSGMLAWPGTAATDGLGELTVRRAAADPGFDWIAYSRGRISVEAAGLPRLVVPAWAEIARVIEDCRG